MTNATQSNHILDVLHEEIIDAVSRFEISGQQAADIALAVESGLRRRCGGRKHYLNAKDGNHRSRQVLHDLRIGIKPPVIAKHRGVSLRWVYRLRQSMND